MLRASESDYLQFMDKCKAMQFSTQFRDPITEIMKQYPILLKHLDSGGYSVAYKIEDSMYQILRNVRNIEIFSSIEKTYFNYEVLDIVSLVEYVRDAVNAVSKTKISASVCQGPVYIESNRALQIHVLLGLVRNALIYTSDEKSVTIHVKTISNRVFIEVTDFGEGIKPEYQNHIFEPFFSVNPYGDCMAKPGLGLDLAILERLQQHVGGSRPVISSKFEKENIVAFSIPILRDPTEQDMAKGVTCDVSNLVTDRFSSLYLQLSGLCNYPE